MCFRVTLVIMVPLYVGHSVWIPTDSDTIDIEQLLRKLISVGPVVEEAVQQTPEFQEVDDRESGGGGNVA